MNIATIWHSNKACLVLEYKTLILSLHGTVAALLSEQLINQIPTEMKGLLATDMNMLALIGEVEARLDALENPHAKLPEGIVLTSTERAKFMPPITNPGKVICLAGNYGEHIEEGGNERAPEKDETNPWLFSKPVSTGLIGDGGHVIVPQNWDKIDWEVELAIVIGRRGKYIKADKANDYIAGYTVFNDISARALNLAPYRKQRPKDPFYDWLHGKQMDNHACMGPWITTKNALNDPQNLDIKLSVNGQIKQNSNTKKMIFFIPEIIEFASKIMTLEPGDIIATGTPAGIGATRGEFLKPGDHIEASIEGIGTLHNNVIAETLMS